MRPNKCEKHQNYKYMNFCPFCKVLADRDTLEKERDELRAAIETWKKEEQCWQDDMKRLRAEVKSWERRFNTVETQLEARTMGWEIERDNLRAALEWYADPKNWTSMTDGWKQLVCVDASDREYIPGNELMIQTGGKRARDALGRNIK